MVKSHTFPTIGSIDLYGSYGSHGTEYDYLLKMLLVGDSGVGKSAVMTRYSDNNFVDRSIPTIGVDFKIQTTCLNGKIYKLQIWDTAGQERFRTITSSYYRGAHGIIIVYDVSNEESFNNVVRWIEECKKHSHENAKIILVGNKTDVKPTVRQVSYNAGQEFAKSQGYRFVETSARTGTGVETVFNELINDIVENNKIGLIRNKPAIRIHPPTQSIEPVMRKCC